MPKALKDDKRLFSIQCIDIIIYRAFIVKASARYGSAFRILFKAASPFLNHVPNTIIRKCRDVANCQLAFRLQLNWEWVTTTTTDNNLNNNNKVQLFMASPIHVMHRVMYNLLCVLWIVYLMHSYNTEYLVSYKPTCKLTSKQAAFLKLVTTYGYSVRLYDNLQI